MSREAGAEGEGRSVLRNFSDLAAKLLVSGGLLYWLLSGFDLATFGNILQRTQIGLFVLAAGFFALSNLLGAFQWFLLLRGQERITPRALVGAAIVVAGVGIVGATA